MDLRCKKTGAEFLVSAAEQEYCRREGMPLPDLSPRYRQMQQTSFRNRCKLYNGICSFSGNKIFTCIAPERGMIVYDIDIYESDRWDPRSFGRPYDFSRPFFEQFADLLKVAPLPNLAVVRSTMENSDFTNGITSARNCYLVFCATENEDCMFSKMINFSKSTVDSVLAQTCELCYDCTNVVQCYNLLYGQACHHCSDSAFLFNCQGCSHCFGCANLTNKQYHYYNQPLSPADYRAKLASIDLGSRKTVEAERRRYADFCAGFPMKYYFGRMNQGSSGNFLYNNKNCTGCYFVHDSEDLEHSLWIISGKSSIMHTMYGNATELVYSSTSCGDNSFNIRFGVDCWKGNNDLEYCWFTRNGSSYCFGSIGLKKKSYCILNKQYSKEEYFELLPRIKDHMRSTGEYGRFFPPELSPFYYNQSDAADFFPLGKSAAEQLGFPWRAESADEGGAPSLLPDHIRETSDSVLSQVFLCSRTGKRYRIIKQELAFYRENNIPLPSIAPLERLRIKSDVLTISPLTPAVCSSCGAAFESSLTASCRALLCEDCFQQAMI